VPWVRLASSRPVSIETRLRRADTIAQRTGRTLRAVDPRHRQSTDPWNIVIYEDDHQTCTLLQEWLSEAGYHIRFGAPCEANRDLPADLVVMSVCLPKQAGANCVRDIQAAHPGTPLIAISGHFRPGLAASGAAAQALGVRQVLAKPLIRGELLGAVRAILNASA